MDMKKGLYRLAIETVETRPDGFGDYEFFGETKYEYIVVNDTEAFKRYLKGRNSDECVVSIAIKRVSDSILVI